MAFCWWHFQMQFLEHSVETPSMLDTQWNMLYWGSKWNLQTVCWGAALCEWGTTSVYFGITYIPFISSRLPSCLCCGAPVTTSGFFIFVKSIIWRTLTKSLKKIHVGLKFEWGLWDKYWLSWELLPFEVSFNCLCDVLLGVTYANMLVTIQWPLKHALLLTSLAWVCVVWRYGSSLELSALWEIVGVSIQISLNFVSSGPIHNRSMLVQVLQTITWNNDGPVRWCICMYLKPLI